MSYIFISYSHDDHAFAEKYAAELERRGFEVWMDQRIDYGDRWFREIAKAIRGCDALSVIMTPAAEESDWVEKEILVAQKHEKPIFPVLLQGREFDLLIDTQFADVRGGDLPPDSFFARLAGSILRRTSQVKPVIKPNTASLNEKLIIRLEVKRALTDELARGIRQFLQNPRGFSLKWRVGETVVSLVRPDNSDEVREDRVEAIISRADLSDVQRRHLELDGWYRGEQGVTTLWIITDESELPGEVALDLIAANEILGLAVEDIKITGGS